MAAHCSGIFSPLRVRNVTSVCYPVKDGQLVRIFVSFLSMPSFKVRIFYFLSMFSLKVRKYDEEEIRFTVSAKFHLFRLEHE